MEIDENDVLRLISEIEKDPKVNLKVPPELIDPDVLVIAAKRQLSLRTKRTEWLLETDGVLIDAGPLEIKVSPKNVERSLRIFDTVIKVFKARGHEFEGSTVTVGHEKYNISIREKLKRIENDYKKLPTGDLCLKMYKGFPRFEIFDSKNVLLEEKIARVVAKTELDAKYWKEVRAQNENRGEEEKVQAEIRSEYLARREKELADFKSLLNSAKRQFEAKLIREHIQSVEENANQSGALTNELENWILWARNKADWYDPLIEKEDELLTLVDKGKLTFRVT